MNIDELLVNTFGCLSVSLSSVVLVFIAVMMPKTNHQLAQASTLTSTLQHPDKTKARKETRNKHAIKAVSERIKSGQLEHLSSCTRGCGRELAHIMCLKHNSLAHAKTSSYKHLLQCTKTYTMFKQPIADETQNIHEDTTKPSEFVGTNSADTS